MKAFFRKIRERLITNNKFTKYLLYAIGEIALVMIGILLALQVNNWNENRKELKQEKDLFKNIMVDLKSDSALAKICLDTLRTQLQVTDLLIKDILNTDSTFYHENAGLVRMNVTYIPRTQRNHAEFVSTIKNSDARKAIQNYFYEEDRVLASRSEHEKVIIEKCRTFLSKNRAYKLPSLYSENPLSISIDQHIVQKLLMNNEIDQILYEVRFKAEVYQQALDRHIKSNITLSNVLQNEIDE